MCVTIQGVVWYSFDFLFVPMVYSPRSWSDCCYSSQLAISYDCMLPLHYDSVANHDDDGLNEVYATIQGVVWYSFDSLCVSMVYPLALGAFAFIARAIGTIIFVGCQYVCTQPVLFALGAIAVIVASLLPPMAIAIALRLCCQL